MEDKWIITCARCRRTIPGEKYLAGSMQREDAIITIGEFDPLVENEKPYLNVSATADYLSVHPNTIKRISPKDLPYFTIGTGLRADRRYAKSDIEKYIQRRLVY